MNDLVLYSSFNTFYMLPKSINPCPIIDAVIEIRFEVNLFSNAVFGIIYKEFQSEYPEVEKLPILQIPEQVRDNDPNFKYKPHYKIYNSNYAVQIGSDVISFCSKIPYKGWVDFSKNAFTFLEKLFGLKIITKINRLGLRYVNFFNSDIYNKTNLQLIISDENVISKNLTIRTEILKNDFVNLVLFANNVQILIEGINSTGSIIDIDTFKEFNDNNFIQNYQNEIVQAHKIEKEIFFSLLNSKFLTTLNPVYETN